MTEDVGDIRAFVNRVTEERSLSESEVLRLVRKTRALEKWAQQLEKVINVMKTYSADHPTPRRAVADWVQTADDLIGSYGPIRLAIGPSFATTGEGYELRRKNVSRNYVFLPLFRDGIRAITIIDAGARELGLLLEVLVAGGRRSGDDAVTWLWSGRLQAIRFEVAPWYPPRVAAALHLAEPGNHVFSAYVGTLLGAGPRATPTDSRVPIGVAQLDQLGLHGLQPHQVRSYLAGGPLDDRFAPPSELVKAQCKALFEDDRELRQRARIIKQRARRTRSK